MFRELEGSPQEVQGFVLEQPEDCLQILIGPFSISRSREAGVHRVVVADHRLPATD